MPKDMSSENLSHQNHHVSNWGGGVLFDIRSNLVQAVSVFKINWSLELAQGSELKDDREKNQWWPSSSGGGWWGWTLMRGRIFSVDYSILHQQSQHRGQPTPEPATVSPPIFQCLTVLPNILPLCDSFATICQWFVQQAPPPTRSSGWAIDSLHPSTLLCYISLLTEIQISMTEII